MRKYLLGLVFALFAVCCIVVVSCKKDKNMVKATVVDTGDIASNGCGYVLQLQDGTMLYPKYLPSNYQNDGEKVKVKYNTDGEGTVCRTYPLQNFLTTIDIVDIKKDLD